MQFVGIHRHSEMNRVAFDGCRAADSESFERTGRRSAAELECDVGAELVAQRYDERKPFDAEARHLRSNHARGNNCPKLATCLPHFGQLCQVAKLAFER